MKYKMQFDKIKCWIQLWPSERKNANCIKWHLKFWKGLWCDEAWPNFKQFAKFGLASFKFKSWSLTFEYLKLFDRKLNILIISVCSIFHHSPCITDTPSYKKTILESKQPVSGINSFFPFSPRISENYYSWVKFIAKFVPQLPICVFLA